MVYERERARCSAAVFYFIGFLGLPLTTGCSSDSAASASAGSSNEGMTTSVAGAPAGGSMAHASGGAAGAATDGVSGNGGTPVGGASGSSGSGGSANVGCKTAGSSGPLFTRLPCLLSETGLYAADMVTIQPGVHPFKPNFALWSDGAEKRRWIALPDGSKIDTSDMDYWSFPTGTKLWKEFSRDGVRVETRLIAKQPSGTWYAVAYHWHADQKDADAVPNGVMNASGTPHDVPNSDQCLTCHSQMPDKALGFSAIQLSHDRTDPSNTLEWTLGALIEAGLLSNPPAAPFTVPGTEAQRNLFGYLHANCGTCHNPKGTQNTQTGLDMWLKVADTANRSPSPRSTRDCTTSTSRGWMAQYPTRRNASPPVR